MIDCWPQISDAVVDWYYTKKLAFDVIARIQVPVCVMLDELEAWSHRVILGNDSREGSTVQYRLIDADTNETLLEGERESPANENIELGEIRVFAGQQRMILIEWTYGRQALYQPLHDRLPLLPRGGHPPVVRAAEGME